MTQSKPIAVDHSQEKATSQVIPDANLLYSCKTALTGMYLEYHHSPPHETPEHYPFQHVIAIQTQGAVQSERRLDGRFRLEYIVAGDICVVPAHTRHWIRSQDEQGLILLSFDPAFLGRVANESVDFDRLEIIPHFAKPDPLIYQIGINLKTALQADLSSRVYAESLGVALAAHLMQYYTAEKRALQIPTKNQPQASIQQAINYINDHLTDDDLSLEAIATTIGMSQYHFCRVFKQATGLTPWQYVVQQRIAAAKRLLAIQELSIAQISLRLGFGNQNQFATFFRKHAGVPPRQYRQGL